MKNFKSGIILTTITTLLAFMSVLYISSCDNKAPALNPATCENYICYNGGTCAYSICTCPIGYQDAHCSTPWNAKFAGTWTIAEYISGSDNYNVVGSNQIYQVKIDTTHVPNDLYITGLNGNAGLTRILGIIDSTNMQFNIQPYTPSGNGNYHITGGTIGLYIVHNGHDTARGTYYNNYINAQSVVEHDTMYVLMTK